MIGRRLTTRQWSHIRDGMVCPTADIPLDPAWISYVTVDIRQQRNASQVDLILWCNENCEQKVRYDLDTIWFERDSDVVKFRLTWSS